MRDRFDTKYGWKDVRLGDLFKLSSGETKPADIETKRTEENLRPVYGGNGIMGFTKDANTDENTIVIGRVGANCGCVHLAREKSWVTDNALRIVERKQKFCPEYLAYHLVFLDLSRLRGQSGQPLVSQGPIHLLKTQVAPLPEQRKIAAILRTWDEALEKLNALRAAKARQLDGLAAKLIHDDQVERLHLREFLTESSTRNRDEQVQRVLSVTNSAGFVLAEEQFAHRVASASLSNYKIVRRGQYAYNPSRINVGSIARLDAWDEGALSPMYVVFQVKRGLDADFFGHWLRSAEARQRIALAAQGSVRETVNFGDLGSILVPVPTMERQKAIAQGLNAARAEISLLDDEIKAVTRQKRGLMQKLLTGEWRVEVSDDEEAAA